MDLRLKRDVFEPNLTLGMMFVDGDFLGYTCEDCDRHLESGGEKIFGQTAIPRGKYRVVMSMSSHFHKEMPEVLGVPKFSGIRIHMGNTAADTEGCILLGSVRTNDGVTTCNDVNVRLRALLEECELRMEEVWLTVE
jgi:hypothetical protein